MKVSDYKEWKGKLILKLIGSHINQQGNNKVEVVKQTLIYVPIIQCTNGKRQLSFIMKMELNSKIVHNMYEIRIETKMIYQ